MNAEGFVEAIRLVVVKASLRGFFESLERPAGQHPSEHLLDLSKWYAQLPDYENQRVRELSSMAVDLAVFNFLSVLDHVLVIERGPGQGDLELYYVKDGERTLLNNPNGPLLHELL